MSEQSKQRHHRIDYIELTVDDLDVAKTFYEAAFEWSFTDYGPGYAGFQRGPGGEMGGLQKGSNANVDGGPLVILYSDDLETTEAAVVSAGGVIATPTFSFPGGRRFHFADPSGNVLGVWTTLDSQ